MTRSAGRRALRIAVHALLVLLGLEIALIVSPFDVLVRSRARAVFLDGDVLYSVPKEVSRAQAGGKVGWERMCSYWGGGAMTFPVPVPVRERCSLFRPKPDGRRLF